LETLKADRLTPKQRETLHLLGQGFTSKEMAQILGVSPSAIDQRIICILRNNGLASRRDLVRLSLKTSSRPTAEAPQVAEGSAEPPLSISDRTHSDLDRRQTSNGVEADTHPYRTLPISEANHQRLSLIAPAWRSVLEATFFAMMTILGACVMLKQIL
jgi:DNA-binding CsgD family transcriptional regulator